MNIEITFWISAIEKMPGSFPIWFNSYLGQLVNTKTSCNMNFYFSSNLSDACLNEITQKRDLITLNGNEISCKSNNWAYTGENPFFNSLRMQKYEKYHYSHLTDTKIMSA